MASAATRRHSSGSASETLEWMNAIASFLLPFRSLLDSHAVNYFKDEWPSSLKEFIINLRALSIFRQQNLAHPILQNMDVVPLGTFLSQGMIAKKKHEVEILATVISKIAQACGAEAVVDVGSGQFGKQGYLAQVLSFEYQLSVIALDALFTMQLSPKDAQTE